MARKRNRFARGGRTQRGPRSIRPSGQLGTAPQQDHGTDTPCLVGTCCDWGWSFTQGWYCKAHWRVFQNGQCICSYAGEWDANITDVSGVKGRKGGRVYQSGGGLNQSCPGGNYGIDEYGNQVCI